ncbi:MAG TPA: tetratricopeptide repeat protein [Gemmatimonadales bacterium]|nr:tetratricopeptide repeat protein [Gemmatimonadales bacterium]
MAAPSEIEKLERRYAENPDGRFFAPLADAYRKAGNLVRALELVRAGLTKHPDYLSAHIVLGRCLLDKNEDAEAEATFRSVLSLDSENIIALKSLAEISERTGRTVEARQWLQKLLVVDPMNAEAEGDLQRLGGVIAQQPTQEIEPVRTEGAADVSFADVAREVEGPAAAAAPEPAPPAPEPVVAAVAAPEPVVAAPEPVPAPEPVVAPAPITVVAPPPVMAPPPAPEPMPEPTPVVSEPVAAAPAPPPAPPVLEPAFAPMATLPPVAPAPVALPPMPAVEPPPLARVEAPPVAEPVAAAPVEPPPAAPAPEPVPEAVAAPEGFVPIGEAATTEAPREPPAAPDRHPLPQELQVGDSGLELMPFDDSLAWGTGERSSRAIRAEDIASVEHDDQLTTPAVEFLAGIEHGAEGAPPEAAPPAAAPAPGGESEFAIERQDEVYFGDATAPPQPENVYLPADLSGAYSIIDMPDSTAPAPPQAEPARETPSGLPLILPEDVTPADELARPSAKLVQMVSPAPPTEDRGGEAGQPMLSETLGDLYLRQGFRNEAADVYRRLLSQRPGDEALRAKLRSVEGPPADLSAAALGAESVGVWLSRVAAARLPGPSSPLPAEAPAGPSPLEAAFAAPAEPAGEPAHPAPDAFSLDQIFGSPAEGQPSAPASAAPPPDAPPAPGASFDEFFGAPPEASSVRPVAPASPDAPAPGGEEDLSAFNAWLQGLKR